MKNLPQNIFLQVAGNTEIKTTDDFSSINLDAVTWSMEEIWNSDFEYIEKSQVERLIRLALNANHNCASINEFLNMELCVSGAKSASGLYKLKPIEWRGSEEAGSWAGRYSQYILAEIEKHQFDFNSFRYSWNVKIMNQSTGRFGTANTLESAKEQAQRAYIELVTEPFELY